MADRSGTSSRTRSPGRSASTLWIGLPETELSRVAYVYDIRLDHLPKPLRTAQESMLAAARDPDKLIGRAFVGNGSASPLDFIETVFNNPEFLAGEVPAGNGIATARAMARCWAMMANGGELDGTRVLSAEVVKEWGHVISNQADVAIKQISDQLGARSARRSPGATHARPPRQRRGARARSPLRPQPECVRRRGSWRSIRVL